jgi:hypothetical protein
VKHGSAGGFYFAAQGGHNAESHNHNDVGNFIVFLDGEPVLIDVGVEIYTAKTFSSRRYEIWTMRSDYHNLPAINGVEQSAGREFAARDVAYRSDDAAAEFSLDIAAAYPEHAKVERWKRDIRLDRRDDSITILDGFALRATSGTVTMSLMTPCEVRKEGSGMVLSPSARIAIEGPSAHEIKVERIDISDPRLKPVWGERVHRVLVNWKDLPRTGELQFRISRA